MCIVKFSGNGYVVMPSQTASVSVHPHSQVEEQSLAVMRTFLHFVEPSSARPTSAKRCNSVPKDHRVQEGGLLDEARPAGALSGIMQTRPCDIETEDLEMDSVESHPTYMLATPSPRYTPQHRRGGFIFHDSSPVPGQVHMSCQQPGAQCLGTIPSECPVTLAHPQYHARAVDLAAARRSPAATIWEQPAEEMSVSSSKSSLSLFNYSELPGAWCSPGASPVSSSCFHRSLLPEVWTPSRS